MNPKVQVRHDMERGCGWRKPGGYYLISSGVSAPCGMLPINLDKCPTCSCGIKPTRGWTWVDPKGLRAGKACAARPEQCAGCPMQSIDGKHGLLWIGGGYYEKPQDWTDEAIRQGVSRRIAMVPKGFELGKTWVFVAHREVSRKACPECESSGFVVDGDTSCSTCKGARTVPQAAIFHAFMPTAIEYVVKGDESDEWLDKIIDKGITPVHVEHDGEAPLLDQVEDETTIEV